MDDGLDVHVVVEPVLAEPDLAHRHVADIAVQVRANAFLPDVDPRRIVRDRIVGEVVGEVRPQPLVEEVAVGALQALDRADVLRRLDLGLQLCKPLRVRLGGVSPLCRRQATDGGAEYEPGHQAQLEAHRSPTASRCGFRR
jgi:hypothetical protein